MNEYMDGRRRGKGGRDQHVAATKIRNYFRATISSGDVSAMPGVSILCHWQHNKN